tara:strand:- start:688 stop:1095 length:408 start_codon:yes stop_codon:yes gene_type:complete
MRINTEWRKFGEGFEKRLFPIIKKNFGEDLVRTKTWEKFDYKSPTKNIELKSRRINSWEYSNTFISPNKLVLEDNKDTIFLFNFKDGLFFINYKENKERIDNCDREEIILKSGLNKGETRQNICIPINILKKIEL